MPTTGSVYIRDISGDVALIDTSGNLKVNVAVGGTGTSGGAVFLGSGSTIGLSGVIVTQAGNTISTGGALITTAASGGAPLPNISCFCVTLKNTSGNTGIWIGGSGNPPIAISGRVSGGLGMVIYPSDPPSKLFISNTNLVWAAAETSGDRLTFAAEAR